MALFTVALFTGQTGDTDHECHKLTIEHDDIIDEPVKPVHKLLVTLR